MLDILYILDGLLYNSIGLIFVVTGAYISIRILDFPDLTIDGVFTLGAVVFARLVIEGFNPFIATLIAASIGIISGSFVQLLNTKLGIGKILSSVLVLIILLSINTYILGQATVGLLNQNTIYSFFENYDLVFNKNFLSASSYSLHPVVIIFFSFVVFLFLFFLKIYFKSESGTILRAIGASINSAKIINKNSSMYKLIGLSLASFLVALGGAFEAQRRGAADLNMGSGMLIIAINAVVVGESITRFFVKRDYLTVVEMIYSIIIGTLVYSFIVEIILLIGWSTVDIKLFTGVFLIILLLITGKRIFRGSEYF